MQQRNRNRTLVLIIACLLISNLALVAYFLWFRQPERRTFPGRMAGRANPERLKKAVGFSAAQDAQFDSLVQQYEAKLLPLMQRARQNRIDLITALKNDTLPDSQLPQFLDRSAANFRMSDSLLARHWQKVLLLCTPEQKEKFIAFLKTMPRGGPPFSRGGGKRTGNRHSLPEK